MSFYITILLPIKIKKNGRTLVFIGLTRNKVMPFSLVHNWPFKTSNFFCCNILSTINPTVDFQNSYQQGCWLSTAVLLLSSFLLLSFSLVCANWYTDVPGSVCHTRSILVRTRTGMSLGLLNGPYDIII